MTKVYATAAFDMTGANLFVDFGKSILASKGMPRIAIGLDVNGKDVISFTAIGNPNKKGKSDAVSFYAKDKFILDDLKLPTGKTINAPVSGDLEEIIIWDFDHKKMQYGQPKLEVDDINLKISDVLKVLTHYNPNKPTDYKPVLKAAGELYAKVFDGNDFLRGSAKTDILRGFDGRDTIVGGASGDTLLGDKGNDELYGEDGRDTLRGGDGNDWLTGGEGADILEGGGKGSDWASYLDAEMQKTKSGAMTTKGVTANLSDFGKNKGDWAAGDKYGSIENLQGSHYDDVLVGSSQRNVLAGDAGVDSLTGGKGADVFLFGDLSGDKITDFNRGGGDKIGLDEDDFKGIGSVGSKDKDGLETIKSNAFWASADGLAHDKDDRILFNTSDGKLWYDADGSELGSASLIAELQGAHRLTANDLRVFDIDLIV